MKTASPLTVLGLPCAQSIGKLPRDRQAPVTTLSCSNSRRDTYSRHHKDLRMWVPRRRSKCTSHVTMSTTHLLSRQASVGSRAVPMRSVLTGCL